MFDPLGNDVVDVIIIQGIVDRLAVPAVLDELAVLEEAKLVRDRRLIHLQQFGDLCDAPPFFKEAVHDAYPCGIGKVLEQFRHIVECILVCCFAHRSFTPNALMALMTAITMTPTSAKIASHICAMPSALRTSVMSLTAIAKMMFS